MADRHKIGNGSQIRFVQGPLIGIATDKRRPSLFVFATEPRSPKKHGKIVRAPTHTAAIEVVNRQRSMWIDVRIRSMEIAVAKAPLQTIRRQFLNEGAQSFRQSYEILPILRSMGQEWLARLQRQGQQMFEIEGKAAVGTLEGIACCVYLRCNFSIPIGFLRPFSFVAWLSPRCV